MDKEQLYRFFEGTTSMEQGMKIKAWVEASEENLRTLQRERKLFDAILLNEETALTKKSIQSVPLSSSRFMGWMKVCAVVAVTLCLSYLYRQYEVSHATLAMSTVSIPAGQRANITLPDGTNVWMNARTTLQYPTSFNGKERKVILKGEAYFQVAKNEKKPFVVETDKCKIEVLGTSFNVDAYPGQETFETALMEGSVKIALNESPEQVLVLTPDQKVCLSEGKLKISKVVDYDPYRWKEGLICFKDDSFAYIMREFEKYYGVKIEIRSKAAAQYNYTGKFRQADGIDYALRVLQNDIYFSYEKDNEKQIIHIND